MEEVKRRELAELDRQAEEAGSKQQEEVAAKAREQGKQAAEYVKGKLAHLPEVRTGLGVAFYVIRRAKSG